MHEAILLATQKKKKKNQKQGLWYLFMKDNEGCNY